MAEIWHPELTHAERSALATLFAVKDRYNNTVRSLPDLFVRASLAHSGFGLIGELLADVNDGVAAFTSVGLNGSTLRAHLRFELILPPSPPASESLRRRVVGCDGCRCVRRSR